VFQQFLNHLQSLSPVERNHTFLLAVSGGIDSMVMLDLFSRAGMTIAVAHCNFQLRPDEAAKEEELVRQVCNQKNIPLFAQRFQTLAYAENEGMSIQMAARELRYRYFDDLRKEHQFNWVATAHHRNDSIETVLFNFIRGTGIGGLTGIAAVNRHIVRPLLFATRSEIENYARENSVSWRDDSSNFSNDYARNFIRNRIVPMLSEINPGFENTFRLTIERLKATKSIVDKVVSDIRAQALSGGRDQRRIALRKNVILQSMSPALILWEIAGVYGFTYDQCVKMVEAEETGKWFLSPTHRLVVDRTEFIIEDILPKSGQQSVIREGDVRATLDEQQIVVAQSAADNVEIAPAEAKAFLDAEKIQFPLTWRYWEPGDTFQPLGMQGKKKISDLLVDRKVDLLAKEKVTVLESSSGEIIWVVGLRISECAKVTDRTRQVLIFDWKKNVSPDIDKTPLI
jgi:tRNA(Ile)-lysidine synthase